MSAVDEIRRQLAAKKPYLQDEYNVQEIGIFGSYARDEQGATSDLDVLVAFSEPIGLLEFVALENELADLLGIEVDLVTKDGLKPRVWDHVADEVVYA
jgi:predicted nucleotidyltransferase